MMRKIIYTLLFTCALYSCTNLESERYDSINPDFFPETEEDADALIVGGVYSPFRSAGYSGIFNCCEWYTNYRRYDN